MQTDTNSSLSTPTHNLTSFPQIRFLIKESTWIFQKSAQESEKQSLHLQLLISFHGLGSKRYFPNLTDREDGKLIALVIVLQSNFQTQSSLSDNLLGVHPHSRVE